MQMILRLQMLNFPQIWHQHFPMLMLLSARTVLELFTRVPSGFFNPKCRVSRCHGGRTSTNSSLLYSSTVRNSSLQSSSTRKVVDPHLVSKQCFFATKFENAIFGHFHPRCNPRCNVVVRTKVLSVGTMSFFLDNQPIGDNKGPGWDSADGYGSPTLTKGGLTGQIVNRTYLILESLLAVKDGPCPSHCVISIFFVFIFLLGRVWTWTFY